jgi:hypothetical protein
MTVADPLGNAEDVRRSGRLQIGMVAVFAIPGRLNRKSCIEEATDLSPRVSLQFLHWHSHFSSASEL